MSWQNIGLILIAGLDAGFALLIWLRNRKNKINISFSLAVLFLALWTLGVAMFKEAKTIESAWHWTWIQNGAGALMVLPFFLFSLYFPYKNWTLKRWQIVLMSLSTVIMIAIVLIPGAWVKTIYLQPQDNDYSLNIFGIIYFNLYLYFYLFLAFYNLIFKHKKSQGFIRKQLFYVILATITIAVFGSTLSALLPMLLLDRLGPYQLGPYFSLPMIILITHFIFREN